MLVLQIQQFVDMIKALNFSFVDYGILANTLKIMIQFFLKGGK